MEYNVRLKDENGNQINIICSCGKEATTIIQSKSAYKGLCSDCAFPGEDLP